MKEKIDVQKPDDLGLDISDLRYFLVMLLFSAVVFFLLISQRLTNTFDGLWNNTWFFGGYWQVVTGRWLWPVIDVLRFGIQTEPFNSLLTLSMSALAVTLLRKFFYREGFCRDLSGGYGCSGQHGHWNTAVISVSVAGVWLLIFVFCSGGRACGSCCRF